MNSMHRNCKNEYCLIHRFSTLAFRRSIAGSCAIDQKIFGKTCDREYEIGEKEASLSELIEFVTNNYRHYCWPAKVKMIKLNVALRKMIFIENMYCSKCNCTLVKIK